MANPRPPISLPIDCERTFSARDHARGTRLARLRGAFPDGFTPMTGRDDALAAREGANASPGVMRASALAYLQTRLEKRRREADAALGGDLEKGLEVARILAAGTDEIVRAAFTFSIGHLHANHCPGKSERITLIAVGGYGREQMAPCSDVDLLFVTPYKQTPWLESVIESTLYMLWDLHMQLGHAVRSIDECASAALHDMTIRTALLERRFVAGDRALYRTLDKKLCDRTRVTGAGRAFIEAKLAERDARHKRAGGSRYLLEPDVKEGKGGLRDLHTLYWIARHLHEAEGGRDWIGQGIFSAQEMRLFRQAESFLWALRCALQLGARRAQNQLTFDRQTELARRFGFRDGKGLLAVEHFMRRYYQIAKQVGDLTRIFCAALEHGQRIGPPPLGAVGRAISRLRGVRREDFTLQSGRLAFSNPERVEREPVMLLSLFHASLELGTEIHPASLRLVTRHLKRIDDRLRADPRAARLFIEMLTSPKNPERALRSMSETGVLGRFIPEFAHVTGMMQFNMYHHYTVDEHTLRAIGILFRIEKGELAQDHPVSDRIVKEGGINRLVLYLALFLHDIGKGLPEKHWIAGERIALAVCGRLGIGEADTEMIAWLVRHHILMSDTAQKRDISDPATVEVFARAVKSPARLHLLLVLTVCDIRAVGPNIWNGWKAQLLRDLHASAMAFLSAGQSGALSTERAEAATAALKARLADWRARDVEAWISRHASAYWLGFDTEAHEAHARMMHERGFPEERPHSAMAGWRFRLRVQYDRMREATRVFLCVDQPKGTFARIAGAFALADFSVVDARSFVSRDGMTLSSYAVREAGGAPISDPVRRQHLQRTLESVLDGTVALNAALGEKPRLPRRTKEFTVPTRVSFDNDASALHTLVEVNALDRPGLLWSLACAFESLNVTVASAVVATYGEQAVDVFYVKDQFGHKLSGEQRLNAIRARLTEMAGQARPEGLPARFDGRPGSSGHP